MRGLDKYYPLIGRVLISLIFITSGFGKIMAFNGTLQFMQAFNVPFTTFALILVIAIEILGGFSLILGYKIKWGAWTLIVFTFATMLIFHLNFADQLQMTTFMKNLAIIGGLLLIVKYGAGGFSVGKK